MRKVVLLFSLFFALSAYAEGNQSVQSFTKAKNLLKKVVYAGHNETFYCRGTFDENNNITLPKGFTAPVHEKRAKKLEWEHVLPAEHFGRAFVEWREGHPGCVDNKGKSFKGRKCAEKANEEFRFMLCDMYNLYPAIGAVNAIRSNIAYDELKSEKNSFGSCPFKVGKNQVEPPPYTRGAIARTYLYFDFEYPKYHMSDSTRKLMMAWDKMYPVDEWECERAKRIEKLQGNENRFVKSKCEEMGFYR